MKRYIVVSSSKYPSFKDEVNEYISQGYIPQGGISVVAGDVEYSRTYYQALYLPEKKD